MKPVDDKVGRMPYIQPGISPDARPSAWSSCGCMGLGGGLGGLPHAGIRRLSLEKRTFGLRIWRDGAVVGQHPRVSWQSPLSTSAPVSHNDKRKHAVTMRTPHGAHFLGVGGPGRLAEAVVAGWHASLPNHYTPGGASTRRPGYAGAAACGLKRQY
ncbi:hypothetical protein M433DRAFT_8166 [Acidomyces richmondensis BFW]|nr:hypothetical protein M433DRAFT_8166 [Acidomyces richmondensis BFW]